MNLLKDVFGDDPFVRRHFFGNVDNIFGALFVVRKLLDLRRQPVSQRRRQLAETQRHLERLLEVVLCVGDLQTEKRVLVAMG